jgi:hypothetical protein
VLTPRPCPGGVLEQDPRPGNAQPDEKARVPEPSFQPDSPDQLIALLGVYATQYASYTTLLWQVPALSLTGQAFLLTIALSNNNGVAAKVTASGLSMIISVAAYLLMHDQRGHAINYGELAKRISDRLDLAAFFGTVRTDDGEPATTTAADLWTWRNQARVIQGKPAFMYATWRQCLLLFFFVDVGVICSVFMPIIAAVLTAAGIAAAGLGCLRLNAVRSHKKADAELP